MACPTVTKFWVVWCEKKGAFNKKHSSAPDALLEARRLAGQHPGDVFQVLVLVGAYAVAAPPPQWFEADVCAEPISRVFTPADGPRVF